MNPELALCDHLREHGEAPLEFRADDVFVWVDGPVTAILRCGECNAAGLLELLDWSRDRRVRVFAVAAMLRGPVDLHLRNVARGSCDAQRARLEREALLASAGPFERIVALDAATNRVLATAWWTPDDAMPAGEWMVRIPALRDDAWFRRLHLDKHVVSR